jgi:tetratricopeptide (TPR) repeat protein
MQRMQVMTRLLLSAVLAMTTIRAPVWSQGSSPKDQGWKGCVNGDADIIIASCTPLAESDAESPWHRTIAFINRGNAYFAKGDFDRAIEDYSHAIRLSPQLNAAFNNRGNAYVAKHDYDRAIHDFNEALRIKPGYLSGTSLPEPFDYANVFANRGLVYFRLNEYDRAIKDFDEAIRLKPDDAESFFNRGIAYNTKGDYDSAIADFNKALQINPNSAYALYSRGIAKRNRDDVNGANADTAAALQIDPEIAAKVGAKDIPVTTAAAELAPTQSAPPCKRRTSAVAQVPTYVDAPIDQLQKMVPDLNQMKLDPGHDASDDRVATPPQDDTAFILSKTGAVIAGLLPRMPNLIAKEEVLQPIGNVNPGSISWREQMEGSVPYAMPVTQYKTRVFDYRIVHKKEASGGDALDEFRTVHNRPIDYSAHNADRPLGVGFATVWLFFFPGNLQESHFRYLGQQKISGRETYVLAFAQIPESMGKGAVIESSYGQCSSPLQGVAWIDQSTFQIVHLQTDLLSPLPGIQLNQLRSILTFGSVKIAGLNLLLLLPSEVQTTWETANYAGEEFHFYSHYRLFQSTMRILPDSESPSK